MDSHESQTEVSIFSTPSKLMEQDATLDKSTKRKKKNKNKNKSMQDEDKETVKSMIISKKSDKSIGSKKVKKELVVHYLKKPVKTEPVFTRIFCNHASVGQKFFISFVLTIICMLLFTKPHGYPIAEYSDFKHNPTFKLVTDEATKTLQFNLENSKRIIEFLPLNSVKSARVKAQIKYNLGYEYESREIVQKGNSPQKVNLSNLKVLDYSILWIDLENKEDGFWNSWEFEDHKNMVEYIQSHYIQEMKKQILQTLTEQQIAGHLNRAIFTLISNINESETRFNWFLKRINKFMDGSLQPYIDELQITFNEKEVGRN